jgi:phage N-6-adenine-methyltransferase
LSISTRAIGSHHHANGGATNDWLTPQWIIDALGPFDLDPCASEAWKSRVAPRFYTWCEDGLAQDWSDAFCFVNPPYSNHVGRWLTRLADHGNGIALVFARTETKAFNANLARATSILFIKGRLTFLRADGGHVPGNSGAASILVAYGERADARLRRSGVPGFIVQPIQTIRGVT